MKEICNIKKNAKLITYLIVVVAMLYAILPMVILKGDYIFVIHDGLDGFAGNAQYISNKGTLFNINDGVEFSTADISKRYFGISYDIYTMLGYGLGYLKGQIITRFLGVIIGYFSFKKLLDYIFPSKSVYQNCIVGLSSIVYIITPIAPNRMFAFATLPCVCLLFLSLKKRERYSWLCMLALFIPFFSSLTVALVFEMGFWVVFTLVLGIKEKKLNINLIVAFVLMCMSTLILYNPILIQALSASETNRSLMDSSSNFLTTFRNNLQNGQYHSTALQGFILLPLVVLMTAWMICYYVRYRKQIDDHFKKNFLIMMVGWGLWTFSAFIEAFQKSGFRVGITLIDGFQWGRLLGFMRPMWFLMIMAFVNCKPKEKIFKNNILSFFIGGVGSILVWYGMKFILGNNITDTLVFSHIFTFFVKVMFVCLGFLLFSSYKYRQYVVWILLFSQLCYVSISDTRYNDTGKTVVLKLQCNETNESITLNEFYSSQLFEEIKKDIVYSGELVAAYGFHPSVLIYNGFETIDRYSSVHSLKMQNQFREIIAPALELYPEWQDYYDTWGGRMYLYGELSYQPDRNKELGEHLLFINTNAFKKYGGRYILSRASISNSEELGLKLIDDYDNETSLYHIFLYEAERSIPVK